MANDDGNASCIYILNSVGNLKTGQIEHRIRANKRGTLRAQVAWKVLMQDADSSLKVVQEPPFIRD
jgi:hypothetical protein